VSIKNLNAKIKVTISAHDTAINIPIFPKIRGKRKINVMGKIKLLIIATSPEYNGFCIAVRYELESIFKPEKINAGQA
jgi:hypothetical protein